MDIEFYCRGDGVLCLLISMMDEPEEKRKIEKLYDAYQKLMIYVAYRILNQIEDAEDAVFFAWEKIIENSQKIQDIECKETKSYIVTITERIAIDMYRRKKRERTVPLEAWENTAFTEVQEPGFEKIELRQRICALPRKYSEVLLLHYVNGYSYAEIGKALGIREGSVASRISRAKKMLQEEGGDM